MIFILVTFVVTGLLAGLLMFGHLSHWPHAVQACLSALLMWGVLLFVLAASHQQLAVRCAS